MSTAGIRRPGLRPAIGGLLLLLAGCGGIEGTGSPQAGVEGTGALDLDGELASIDTVDVGGAALSTEGAEVLVDGMPTDVSALQPGRALDVGGVLASVDTADVVGAVLGTSSIEALMDAIPVDAAALQPGSVLDVGGVLASVDTVDVGGVALSTDSAEVLMDGLPADASALQPGMVLGVIEGTMAGDAQRSASRIEFDTPLYGPVDSIAPDGSQVSVLGQVVQLDEATRLNGEAGKNLQEGQVCLVSGHAGSREWLATLLDCRDGYVPGGTLVEVEGALEALDDQGFTLGTLRVDSNTAFIDATAGPLIEGAWVEVMGVQPQPGGALQAEYIRVKQAP